MKKVPLRSWLIPAILAAGLIVSFYDVVFLGRTFLTTNFTAGTDPSGSGSWGYEGIERPWSECPVIDPMAPAWAHEPDARQARKRIWDGEFPLWNPHVGAGLPFWAVMHNALLFPPKLILLISDAPWVWDTFILLRLFLAGVFTALFLRLMGLRRVPSLFGGYAYMLCGFHVWNINIMFVNAAVALPFLFYAAEKTVRSPSPWAMLLLAVALAVEIFAGAAETAAFALVAAAAYTVFRLLTLPERKEMFRRRFLAAGGAGLLGIGLSAPLWIPFLESLGQVFHIHGPRVGRISLPLGSLPQIAAPHMLGSLNDRWDGSLAAYDPGYSGALVIILAVMAAIDGVGRRRPWVFFTGVALFFGLKIFGFPGFDWLVAQLPLFDRAHLTRWSSPVLFFSLAVLAAVSVDRTTRGGGRRLQAAAVGILAALLLTLWAFAPPASEKESLGRLVKGLLAPILIASVVIFLGAARRRGRLSGAGLGACLLALLAVELYLPVPRTRLDRSDPFAEPPFVRFLKEKQEEGPFRVTGMWKILHPNVASAYGLDDIGVPLPFVPHRYVRWIQARLGPDQSFLSILLPSWIPDPQDDSMALLNLKYLITHPHEPGGWDKGPTSEAGPGNVPAGEIVAGRELGQTFLSQTDSFCGVSVSLATFGRENRGTLEFRLYEGMPTASPIRSVKRQMEAVRGNVDNLFAFDPVHDSRGRWYTFSLSSPDASAGNAITAWMHPVGRYPPGQRLENGRPEEGDLGFTVHSTSSGSRYRLVYDEEVRIFENRACLPRAYVVPTAEWALSQEAALDQMGESTFDPRRTVILEGDPGTAVPLVGTWSADGSRARITERRANKVRITVDVESHGYLVLLDTYFPGWRAEVDGKTAPIYPANGLFRAVRVSAGRHEVVFSYLPTSFLLGLGLAAVAAAILAWLLLRERSRGRISSRSAGPSDDHRERPSG